MSYHFDEKKHVHTLDGKPLYGVTTVLGVIAKPALIQWSANMAVQYIKDRATDVDIDTLINVVIPEAKYAHRKKKEDAGLSGTDIHNMIEEYVKTAIDNYNGIIIEDEHENKQIDNFLKWAKTNEIRFVESEKHLYSEEHWVGGIADLVFEWDDELFVGDIKTSSNVYPEHFLQMGAYCLMLEERGVVDETPKGFVVINLDKKGGIKVKKSYAIEQNKKGFLSALNLYKTLETLKKTL